MQHLDCELCNAREKYGVEMRRRLDELSWRVQPRSLSDADKLVFDSKSGEVAGSPPMSLAQKRKKTA
jgi:hypothetical protein